LGRQHGRYMRRTGFAGVRSVGVGVRPCHCHGRQLHSVDTQCHKSAWLLLCQAVLAACQGRARLLLHARTHVSHPPTPSTPEQGPLAPESGRRAQPVHLHGSYGREAATGRGTVFATRELLKAFHMGGISGKTFVIQARRCTRRCGSVWPLLPPPEWPACSSVGARSMLGTAGKQALLLYGFMCGAW